MGSKKQCKRKGLTQRNGHWWGQCVQRDPHTKALIRRWRFSIDVLAGHHIEAKGEAEAIFDKAKTAIREGTFETMGLSSASALRLPDVVKLYTDTYLSQRSGRGQEAILSRFVAKLGARVFSEIHTLDVDSYLAGLRESELLNNHKTPRVRSVATINRHTVRLRHLWTWAIERQLADRTPFRDERGKVLIRVQAGEQHREVTMTPEEQPRLLLACDPELRAWTTVALDTGLRHGEQFGRFNRTTGRFDPTSGIRVRDVNFVTKKLMVRPEVAKTRKLRTIPIRTSRGYSALWAACHNEHGKMRPADALIFVTIDEKPIPAGVPLGRLQSACGRAKTTRLRWHDLRHQFASDLYYRCSVPLQIVQKLLGHASIEQTMTYLNVRDEGIEEAMDRLGSLRGENDTTTTQRVTAESDLA